MISRRTKISAAVAVTCLIMAMVWSKAYDYFAHRRLHFEGYLDHVIPTPVRVLLIAFVFFSAIAIALMAWDVIRSSLRAKTR